MTEIVSIPTLSGDGSFNSYVARPAGEAKAAILVIQEIFGVNAGIRRKCDKWAEAGYLAVAPDLFYRIESGIELDPDVEPEMACAMELFGQYKPDEGICDIEATIHWIRNEAGVEKVGAVGYCLGGKLAYMTAARTDIDASVGYYGVMIDQMLHEAKAIAHPLMLHIPTADHFVNAAAQRAMHDALDNHPKVTLHDYAGLDHGFATEHGDRRDEDGATLADNRTEAFFKQHLA